jgi:hypothetical protein
VVFCATSDPHVVARAYGVIDAPIQKPIGCISSRTLFAKQGVVAPVAIAHITECYGIVGNLKSLQLISQRQIVVFFLLAFACNFSASV